MGRPWVSRPVKRMFWDAVLVEGVSTDEASVRVGVRRSTGQAWFAEAGGMRPSHLTGPRSDRYLSLADREEIMCGLRAKESMRSIATRLGRSASTISREVDRNWSSGGRDGSYRASAAHRKAENRARRPKPSKLEQDRRLCEHVQTGLLQGWSPDQISRRLIEEFPGDAEMRVSHETIYRELYVQGRGGLRRELSVCLRTGRAVRKPRRRAGIARERITDKVMISERPAEAADRAVPGHWEGDLIIGKNGRSAIGTLVERSTRFVMLLHLPNGNRAEVVRDAIVAKVEQLPDQLKASLTWDQGMEMARHTQITVTTGLPVYFCDPHSPWQRGSNENTNGLLRQYFPKGTDLSVHRPEHLDAVAAQLNGRPRKTLRYHTPGEMLAALLSGHEPSIGVATIP
jgi:transposase, IS30 family